ncbi:ANTAR domain-containing protein [Streptomyces sp. NBC_01304]|uniref:ANTAR domain-containing protein n=1 Tax=Streptomyces sp. NBC_01304 TaxID=2903818 RepID=UPI002E1626EC|nr:ANTAR domain-containing protein [Streptomyces sp. NBC_01304]
MSLYAPEIGSFSIPVRDQAAAFAGYAAGDLGIAIKIAEQTQFNDDLQSALASRTVIGQALGIIMAQQHCPADRSFEILSRASQNRNMKLGDVATGVVAKVSGSPPSTRHLSLRESPPWLGRHQPCCVAAADLCFRPVRPFRRRSPG